MRELDGGKDDVHLSPYSRAKRERMSALAALAVRDAILVSFYSSRLRLASPLAQRRRDRDPRARPALPFLYLRLYLGFPEIREEPNRARPGSQPLRSLSRGNPGFPRRPFFPNADSGIGQARVNGRLRSDERTRWDCLLEQGSLGRSGLVG